MEPVPLLIHNAAHDGQFVDVLSPWNGELVGRAAVAGDRAIEQALQNAVNAGMQMRSMPAHKRSSILRRTADKLREHVQELAELIALEGGKPFKDALVEARRAAITIDTCADEALQLHGEQLSMERAPGTEQHLAFTLRVPVGPVLAISAFNHPLNLACHQIGPALAAGNPVVFKPASQTPLTPLRLARFLLEAGLPPEALSVAVCSGSKAEPMISDPRIRFVSFIGSEAVGWTIPGKVAPGTRYTLEHGGTACSIVHLDADLELSAKAITRGAFYHAGQVCVSTQLLFVHERIHDTFVDFLKSNATALKVGDPSSPETDVGPVVSAAELKRIDETVKQAVAGGARLVCGGKPLPGNCYSPTILAGVKAEMRVVRDEIFGPVLALRSYKHLDEVFSLINSSRYSFQNSIFCRDIDLALRAARSVDCRGFMINDSTAFRVDWMPFGASRHSGLGTGGVKYSMLDMTEEKLIVMREAAPL